MNRRRFTILACAAALVTGSITVLITPASAAGVNASCKGSFRSTFSPAIIATVRSVTSTTNSQYNDCVTGRPGDGHNSSTNDVSCRSVRTTVAPVEETITWDYSEEPKQSKIVYNKVDVDGPSVIWEGKVASGRFQGDSVRKVMQVTSWNQDGYQCLFPENDVFGGELTEVGGDTEITVTSIR